MHHGACVDSLDGLLFGLREPVRDVAFSHFKHRIYRRGKERLYNLVKFLVLTLTRD